MSDRIECFRGLLDTDDRLTSYARYNALLLYLIIDIVDVCIRREANGRSLALCKLKQEYYIVFVLLLHVLAFSVQLT
jgi:hypothetical protein